MIPHLISWSSQSNFFGEIIDVLQTRLLDMLDEYSIVRQEKEEEKRRARVCLHIRDLL